MGRVKTNVMELVLKEILVGKKIYDDNDNQITIDDVNYQPLTNVVYLKSGENGYKLSMNEMYDFELGNGENDDRILPNIGKIISANRKNR